MSKPYHRVNTTIALIPRTNKVEWILILAKLLYQKLVLSRLINKSNMIAENFNYATTIFSNFAIQGH